MTRAGQYVPALGVLALCMFNPWGYAALPDIGIVLVAILVSATLVVTVRHGVLRCDRTMVYLAMAIVFALVSSLASGAPLLAIFGGLTRSSGLMSVIIWFFAFTAGLQVGSGQSDGDRNRQFTLLVRSSALFALLVILGRIGLAVVPSPGGSRASGPLGSSAFTGAVLVLIAPLGVTSLFHRHEKQRYEGLGLITLCAVALIATGARASWLAAVVAAVLAWAATLKQNRDNSKPVPGFRITALAVVIVMIAGAASMVAFNVGGRLTSIGQANGTAAGRTVLWGAGLRAISENVVLGTGFDQQESALTDALPSDFELRFDDAVITDRAHNWIIDLWLGGGILVVMALTGAIICAVRRNRRDLMGIAVTTGTVGYLVQAQFNFSLPAVEALMWMLLGAAAAPRSKPLRLAIQPVIPTALVGLLICVPFLLNIAGDIQLERGRSAEVGNDLLGAQAYYESASSLASWQPAMEEVRARFAIRASDFNTAQKASREATTRSGNQLRWRELEAETMLSAEQYAQSFAAYQALLRERQNDSSLYVGLGFASLGLVDNSGALVAFNTALQINPDSVGAQAGLEELRKK